MSKVLNLRQKTTILVIGLSCLLSACNLQQTPLNATPTLQPTPTALNQPTEQPTRTPIDQPNSVQPTAQQLQSSLIAPPLPNFQTPTTIPLGTTPNPASGTIIPTVSTQQAVKSTTIQASAGKTVGLNYVVSLTMGSVTLTMQGPAGVVWQKTFTAAETGRVEVPIQQSGAYDVMAQTDHFEGNYQLSWD
jgi:hypothetical protein